MKRLERLMKEQNGLCFFCNQLLPKEEASIEHLVAVSLGGKNDDDGIHDGNTVACCKTFNCLLGSKSIKEKIKIVLHQKEQFNCPGYCNAIQNTQDTKTVLDDNAEAVFERLKQMKNSKPKTLQSLKNYIYHFFNHKVSFSDIKNIICQLESAQKLSILNNSKKIIYSI